MHSPRVNSFHAPGEWGSGGYIGDVGESLGMGDEMESMF